MQRIDIGGKAQHVVGDGPALFIGQIGGERRHGGAVQTRAHGPKNIGHVGSRLKYSCREIAREQRKAPIIFQSRRRWAPAPGIVERLVVLYPGTAVAVPAPSFVDIKFLALSDELFARRGRIGKMNRRFLQVLVFPCW